jgi:hypothetical protein
VRAARRVAQSWSSRPEDKLTGETSDGREIALFVHNSLLNHWS